MSFILIYRAIVPLPPLLVTLLLATGPVRIPSAPPVTVERSAYLMGTMLRVAVAVPDRAAGIAAIDSAFEAVRRTDALLSTWRDDSELARLNRAPVGMPIVLSAELYRLLQEAAGWVEATG